MKKSILTAIIFLVLLGPGTSLALDTLWTRVLDDVENNWITSVRCRETTIYIGGTFLDETDMNENTYIAKFSGDGNPVWAAFIDTDNSQMGGKVAVGPDQSPYLGLTAGRDPMRAVLTKFNPSGESLWIRTDDRVLLSALTVDDANNGYMFGSTGPGPVPAESLWLVRYNPAGNLTWRKTLHVGTEHKANGICWTSNDELVIAAQVATDTDTMSAMLAKLSTTGDTLWTKWLSRGFADEFKALAAGPANTFLAIVDGTAGRRLVRFAPDGDTLWTTKLDLFGLASDLAVDSLGNSFVAHTGRAGGREFEVDKYGPDGSFLGTGRATALDDNQPNSVAVNTQGRPVVGGMRMSRPYFWGYLVKFSGTSTRVFEPVTERPLSPARLLGTVSNGSRLDWQIQRAANYRFSVFDAAGRQMFRCDATVAAGRYSLGLPGLAAGAYMVRLETGSSAFTEKFVVQR